MTGVLGSLVGLACPIVAMLILLRRTRARDLGYIGCLCAAFGLGVGVSSLTWWLLRRLPFASSTTLPYLDAGIWLVAASALALRLPRPPRVPAGAQSSLQAQRRNRLEVLAASSILVPIAVIAVVTFASRSFVVPHGEWDAWAIWNVRARALFLGLAAPGVDAAAMPLLAHPDYPELVPGAIARAWTFAGVDHVIVPIVLAAMFAASAALLAGASVRHHSTIAAGLVTASFILASPALVNWTWSQGTDVPLSFYILLTFVFCASASAAEGAASLWALAGLSAGLAAWTKNEGILFVLVTALIVAICTWRNGRRPIAAFAAGAAPALIILLLFESSVGQTNEHVATLSLSRVATEFTWDRISMVSEAMGRELWYGGATTIGTLPLLALFVALSGVPGRRAPGARLALIAIATMLVGVAVVYVMTPRDLAWHLRTSLDRVLLQLMPATVWVGMLLAAGQPSRYAQLARQP